MNDLADLQDKFQTYLLHSSNQIEHSIVGTENVPVELRLMIYGDAYRARLLEALESTYTALKAYMGDDDFYQLGHEYIDAFPSTYRSIRWFGDQLPDFLKNHIQYCDYPFLSELAKIEWAMTIVFDAADSDVLKTEDMNNIPADKWENMQIQLHPSVSLLSLSWNVFEIWQNISSDQEPPEPVCSEAPVVWILWRNELLNHYSSLSEDEAWAINMVTNGYTFGMLCEGLCKWTDEQNAVARAAILLKGWIIAGLVQKDIRILSE